MSQIYNVLLIDDHPIIADAYKSAFEFINSENEAVEFDIKIVTNCDDAIVTITVDISIFAKPLHHKSMFFIIKTFISISN